MTVTAADVSRGELMLPEIAVPVVPISAPGDVPTLTFQRTDGSKGSLADYRGRYMLVHFWASWCAPCRQQLPALRRLQTRFADRKLARLSLSLDEDAAAWQAALKQLDSFADEGRLTVAAAAGISSVPSYWLLDPSGKLIVKASDLNELTPTLAERLK